MLHKKLIKTFPILIAFLAVFISCEVTFASDDPQGANKLVYKIPIEKEIERGLEAFLKRTTDEAIEAGANHIIFEIDTPGGRVDSAGQIGTLIQSLPIESTAYIVNEALSAGSYIALNANNIYMTPHSTMGASGVITQDGSAADKKAQSAWIAAMKSAAESSGRDPLYAEAMANNEIDLPEYGAPKGEFLTLSPNEAEEVGYAEGIVKNEAELLYELNLKGAQVVELETTFAEEVARFITSPVVIPILLSIASLGLVVELYSPGFGVAGTMGLIALILFFYGHIIAGLAGLEAVVLLILGIALIVLEIFVTSGLLGFIGIGLIICSLFMAGYDFVHMSMSVAIALIIAIVVAIFLFRSIGMDKGLFRHLVLRDRTMTDEGYVSSVSRKELLDKTGYAVTPLRPSGTIEIDNERLDVVTEGNYVKTGEKVKVVHVEGGRIVVQKDEK